MRTFHPSTPGRLAGVAGFALMEIVVAASILSILAATLAVRAGAMIDTAGVTRVVDLVGSLETACAAYHADVGELPYEYSGYSATHRKLSGLQSADGWSGPYLEQPLTHGLNPHGGSLHLYSGVTTNGWVSGFDTDGDGADDVTAEGNMLYLTEVTANSAKAIDRNLDADIGGSWSASGRVRYDAQKKRLLILVYH